MGRAVDTDGTGSLFFPLCAVVLAEQSIVFLRGMFPLGRSPKVLSCTWREMRWNGSTISCDFGYGPNIWKFLLSYSHQIIVH